MRNVYAAIQVVAVTRVGNSLGENSVDAAKTSAVVSPCLASIFSSMIAVLLFVIQTSWARLFTSDEQVCCIEKCSASMITNNFELIELFRVLIRLIAYAVQVVGHLSHIFPVLVVYTVADGVQGSLTGEFGLRKYTNYDTISIFSSLDNAAIHSIYFVSCQVQVSLKASANRKSVAQL